MSGATISSKASTSGQKVSMFAAKSGFVIPKNKLSGSLVPISGGAKKLGGVDAFNGESGKQVQRKTKWSPDLTQDAAVRRGKALAYQTRVDQITQQLKSRVSEVENHLDSTFAAQNADEESSKYQIDNEELEQLQLEKREIIGEILKLNPSYKAPPDYKPLLKETRVLIPVKEYPGYNFVGLIYGSGNDNKKRLEKETGAKIQVYGTKVETGEKVAIKSSEGSEIHGVFEGLYVHISADTFEKVDAAVSVIELLITSVAENLAAASTTSNLASGDNSNVPSQGQQDASSSDLVPNSAMQPVAVPTLAPPQGQFQYPSPWFPTGPHSSPMQLPGLIHPPNSSVLIPNNPANLSTSPFKPSNMPSLFGPPPVPVPTEKSFCASQPFSAQPKDSAVFPGTGSQMPQMGSLGINRPIMHSLPQPALSATGSSTLWSSRAPAIAPASVGFNNAAQMAPAVVPPPGPLQSNMSTGITVSTGTFPPGPSAQLSSTPLNHPTMAPGFASVPRPHMGFPPSGSASVPSSGPSSSLSQPMQSGIPSSGSRSMPNFAPIRPPLVTAPSSGDFTFQPHRPQFPASQRPNSQSATQNTLPTNLVPQPLAPQTQGRFPVANLTPQPVTQAFSRLQAGNHMGQPQSHISAVPFSHNPTAISAPARPPFPEAGTSAARTQILHMGPRNFNPAPQIPNLPGPFPPRPANLAQQTYPVHSNWRGNPSFNYARPASSPSGEPQLYDPFSPTSMPSSSEQQGGNATKGRK
ncbi:hypothetical protein FNV43_RR14116 [Rhamnella rubrinervis]|uniref:K Homology domain-containing protein n=1 Tax=Rhamnella rubrinervis TaxID=2594499 RepID=A0A8K0MFB0_9ROSA|nr:hypothetical protein FNV43_RR14116 [Rhamnella rubrinervis]